MVRHGSRVADDNQLHAGAGDSHVHAAQVAQESNLSLIVGTHQTDDDDIPFLSLKSVHGIHAYQSAIRLEALLHPDELAQILHLCPVRRDDAHVQSLVQHPLSANLLKVSRQRIESQCRLLLIDSAEALAHKLLFRVHLRRVYPHHRCVPVQNAAVFYLRCRLHLAVVEPVAGEPHNLFVHPILHLEQRHRLRFILHDAFHQRLVQSALQCRHALHRRRQLTVVARQHHSGSLPYGNPAGSLQRLRRLINKECTELLPFQHAVGAARERRGNHPRLGKQLRIYFYLQLRGAVLQPVHLLIPPVSILTVAPYLPDSLSDAPQLRIIRMRLKSPLIRKREHLVVHACRITYSQHVHPAVNQLFRNPVHRHIALRAHHHLVLPAQRFVDSLHQRGSLPRARRSMNDGHILCPHHLVHRLLLRTVQPGESQGVESEFPRFHRCAVEQIPQISQSVILGIDGAVQRVEHQFITRLVKEELHPQPVSVLQFYRHTRLWNHHRHHVIFHIAHGGGKVHILQFLVLRGSKEAHRSAEFKVMFHVRIVRPSNLYNKLVERVIVAPPRRNGKPAVAPFHLALQPHRLRLPSEGLLLGIIFYFQQQTLPLQFQF